ncbi:hypothetical protein AMAG_20742 [Allomyces macrogynus ATCC 38327]|uniref:Retrovirus-related Pol polyprotein from transposon TNT 1-94-like beta-barrel domain-containing protein n=1 Tax=Allomyces macrogynus (strain ATCC 38327) TaxID=578462 RepID=A0A0L0TFC0_ALLM3|nr:hypothetical protein AMAG_20742 [Allomyces macrogynus ATCC 38327]|eukprot:KNE73299.1 hypothetical protein AMAG_20742 [Allomyces macrogynus ATCC 38327]
MKDRILTIISPKVDSAAGAHFCGDKSLFATLNDMRPGEGFLVSLGDHRVCHPIGKRTMRIRTPSGNIVHLDPVWYIPGFKTLVSVSELACGHGDTWIVPGVCEKGTNQGRAGARRLG